jgi:hypothetical protein
VVRVVVLTVLASGMLLLGPFVHPAAAGVPLVIDWGTSIYKVGEVAPPYQDALARQTKKHLAIGYKYSYVGVFWIDLWTWGGEYCLFEGKTFYRVPEAEIEKMRAAGTALQRPWLYRFPPGILLIGLVMTAGLTVGVVNGMFRGSAGASPSNSLLTS